MVQLIEHWHYYTKAEGLNLAIETGKNSKKFKKAFFRNGSTVVEPMSYFHKVLGSKPATAPGTRREKIAKVNQARAAAVVQFVEH